MLINNIIKHALSTTSGYSIEGLLYTAGARRPINIKIRPLQVKYPSRLLPHTCLFVSSYNHEIKDSC